MANIDVFFWKCQMSKAIFKNILYNKYGLFLGILEFHT